MVTLSRIEEYWYLLGRTVAISPKTLVIDKDNDLQFNIFSPDNAVYNIVAVYAPNKVQENFHFIKSLPGKLKKEEESQIIIGDYNTTLDPLLDKVNYKNDDHTKTRDVINSWLMDKDFIDAFRYLYSDEKHIHTDETVLKHRKPD